MARKRKRARPERVTTSDVAWFDHDNKYVGNKYGTRGRRKALVFAILKLAVQAYNAKASETVAIHPVVRSRRPFPWPFRYRGLTVHHTLSPEAENVIVVDAGDETYGLAWEGRFFWRRSLRLKDSGNKTHLWFPIPKLSKSDLTNPMLQALLKALRALAQSKD